MYWNVFKNKIKTFKKVIYYRKIKLCKTEFSIKRNQFNNLTEVLGKK